MLRQLKLAQHKIDAFRYVPPIVRPLITAALAGDDLDRVVRGITSALGFDSFTYGISLDDVPTIDARKFVFTTLPTDWVRRYEQCHYIAIDPRIRATLSCPLPMAWDQKSYRGESSKLDQFLDDAQKFGIASGISFPIRDSRGRPALGALSSVIPDNDEVRMQHINRNLGDIILFGQYFHELLMVALVDREAQAIEPGPRLSPRERECIALAARGLASGDISERLHITVRTVQMHFDSVRAKLGAANRQEAVALAMKRGIIVV